MLPTPTAPSARPVPSYFEYPMSMSSLNATHRAGLHAFCVVATTSVVCTLSVLSFLTYRAAFWKRYYISTLVYNQNLILLFNLLLGDLFTSSALLVSYHWSHVDGILAPTLAYNTQGIIANVGDLASGCFVFLIAIHTAATVIWNFRMPWKYLLMTIAFCWVFALVTSLLGLGFFGSSYIAASGIWCWISPEHESARLWAHYVWIFIFEFETLIIYTATFVIVRKRIVACRSHMRMTISLSTFNKDASKTTSGKYASQSNRSRQPKNTRVNRATWYMIIYPVVYFICTAPVAAGRMYQMSTGKRTPEWFYVLAGCCINSCGWIDCIVYTLTRRVFVKSREKVPESPVQRANRVIVRCLAKDNPRYYEKSLQSQ